MLLTRLPLGGKPNPTLCKHSASKDHLVRLACLRHAASVHPEPGSNSPKKYFFELILTCYSKIDVLLSFQRTFYQVAFLSKDFLYYNKVFFYSQDIF